MELIPGPWYSMTRRQKAVAWTRYRLPYILVAPHRMARYLWTYYVSCRKYPTNGWGDREVNEYEIVPHPRHILPIIWHRSGHGLGRYGTLVLPDREPSDEDDGVFTIKAIRGAW